MRKSNIKNKLTDTKIPQKQGLKSISKRLASVLMSLVIGFNLCTSFLYAQSPMKTGIWAKISLEESGLYVLEDSDIKSLGLNDLSKVCVWGFGGALMPEIIGEVAERKLEQVPTLLRDGKLYFYAEGLTQWDYNAENDFFHHRTNHYTNKAFYLLSQTDTEPLRMQEEQAEKSSEGSTEASRSYIQTIVQDFNGYSPAHSGRKLYDKLLYTTLQHNFATQQAKSLRLSLAYMSYPRQGSDGIDILVNGKPYFDTKISKEEIERQSSAFFQGFYGMDKSLCEQKAFKFSQASNQFSISLQPKKSVNTTQVNYYELNILSELTDLKGQITLRRSPKTRNSADVYTHYSLPKQGDVYLFALDRKSYFGASATKLITFDKGTKGASLELNLKKKNDLDAPRTYLALNLSSAYKPSLLGKVANQDILGDKQAVELIMICPNHLKAQAQRLQAHYESQGIKSLIWTQKEVFNAFNGGTPDAMAYRLLAKHYYDNVKGGTKQKSNFSPLSLLLFGDASYDNRKISAEWQSKNLQEQEFLLSYQSVNSLDLSSYTSDDFFGVLEDDGLSSAYLNKGKGFSSVNFEQDYIPDLAKELLTISVGRLPLRSKREAQAVVDKIISYDRDKSYGAWKMKAVFVADNGDGNSHTKQSIEITERLEELAPTIQVNKVYMPAYMREFSGGRASVPKAQKDFFEALKRGVMLVNYNGHGGPNIWSDEQILSDTDVRSFSHKHLPLWITATCDFSPFDVPSTSAGEKILLHPTSGGIALLSTTRIVWDIPNKRLNKALIEELFSAQKDGSYLRLGEAVRRAKNRMRNQPTPENRLNFVLLGSPLQRLVLPEDKVVLNKINDKVIEEQEVVEIHALDKVQIAGYVKREAQDIDGDFQGKMEVLVYDGEDEIETIDNFNSRGSAVAPVKYRDFLNLIYTSSVEIKDGQYHFDFVIPKDVAYSGRKGKINFYAYDHKRQKEVVGYARNLKIEAGGSNQNNDDNKAPQILELKLSNKDVKANILVPEINELYVLIKEQTGLNLSNAGLGHQMSLQIDGAKGIKINLTPYYSSHSKEKGLGIIKLVLPKLSNGRHTAELRLCDVYNNVTTKTFDFVVREGLAPHIEELKLSIAKGGMLIVKHDQPSMPLVADVEVFDMSGRLVLAKSKIMLAPSSAYVAYPLANLGLEGIKSLPTEIYILRLNLRSKTKASVIGSKAVKFAKP